MKSSRLLPLLATSIALPSVSALSWKFDSKQATCGGDPFTDVYITSTCIETFACKTGTCKHKTACGMGGTPDITGRLTAISAFPNSQVVVQPCMSGYCSKRDAKVDGRVCNWITPISGQECGEAGAYQFDYSITLPDQDSVPRGMGWLFKSLTVKVQIEKETSCQSESNSRYQMPNPIVSFGIVAGALAAFCRERRRNRDDDDDDDEDDESYFEEDSYVEMGSTSSSRQSQTASPAVVHLDNLPPEDLSQHPVRNLPPLGNLSLSPVKNNPADGTENDRQAKQQIPLEVLRQWYEHQGIAIV